MSAERKISPDARRAQLDALAANDLGRELVAMIRATQARDAVAQRARDTAEREEAAIKSTIAAEHEGFAAANLFWFGNTDGEGHCASRYREQAALLLNGAAHPSMLVATALARAERVQSFARVLELGDVDGKTAEDALFTLARMAEEVVNVLCAASVHHGVTRAPPPAPPTR